MTAASPKGERSTKPIQKLRSGEPTIPSQPALDSLRADRMSYIADMICELQALAHEAKCTTLAGILGLAHAEAQQQSQKMGSQV